MNDGLFRKLLPEEKEEFRQWARDNYVVGTAIDRMWHPVCRAECKAMNEEAEAAK